MYFFHCAAAVDNVSDTSSGDIAVKVATTGDQSWAPNLLVKARYALNDAKVSCWSDLQSCCYNPVLFKKLVSKWYANPIKIDASQYTGISLWREFSLMKRMPFLWGMKLFLVSGTRVLLSDCHTHESDEFHCPGCLGAVDVCVCTQLTA